MPVYRVFIDETDTGEFVTASSPQDAYFDVATALPLKYENTVRLERVNLPDERPGYPEGILSIAAVTNSTLEQQTELPKPAARLESGEQKK